MPRFASRESDERLLAALAARARGLTIRQAAEEAGLPVATVQNMIGPIRSDDIAMSGEPPQEVAAAYTKGAGR